MSRRHKIRPGDRVNDRRRIPNANGTVRRIIYGDEGPEEVVVKFDDTTVEYEYDEFRYSYTERFGYILQP